MSTARPPGSPASLKSTLARTGTPGRFAIGAVAVAAVVAAVSARGLVRALFAPTPTAIAIASESSKDQSARFQGLVAQIDGRSLFFVPGPPPPPPPPEAPHVPPPAPPPDPPPTKYGGPTPMAMMNGTVWFTGGAKLKAGEKNDEVRVVRLDPPWSAVLAWKGVDFTVNLFERDGVVLKKSPAPPVASGAQGAAEPSEPKPPAAETPAESAKPENAKEPPAPATEPKPVAPAQPADPGDGAVKERP